ncbi:MAG: bifunctional [glutamate--ammonia ligase]-adenylyl-L-tyrosine phosphorylase/[glutamate--ammonia-ligase] adenylyltransferase [Alcaligenaceae bacterium]
MSESDFSSALAWSGSLRRLTQSDPAFSRWLEQEYARPITTGRLHDWFAELAGAPVGHAVLELSACRQVLRALRKRTFFLLMVRDLAGLATLDEVVGTMTTLADRCIEQAYRTIMHDMIALHGRPKDALTGLPQEMLIIGMGKLGGAELNVSSDIDLVMLYNEEGETEGPRPLSYHEFYGRLTRRMMPVLSELDANGQVFRTDLRLRPDGDAGPLAWSLDAFEQYLFTQGREWERYAWLKARVIPARAFDDSDSTTQERQFESLRQPFVYRKYFDFSTLAALRTLRERIRLDLQRKSLTRPGLETQLNIKLGEGGIREIEFVVQLVQLIKGGRMPALQQRGLLPALEAQTRAALIPNATAEQLAQAYHFMRRTEHALQYAEDEQTHQLPAQRERLGELARAMRLSLSEFEQTLAKHRLFVAETFRDSFRIAGLGDGYNEAERELQEKSAPTLSLEASILAFGEHSAALASRVDTFLEGHRIRALSTSSRNRIDTLLPLALIAAQHTTQPLTAALRLLDLIETVAQRGAYLALLAEYPETMARIARMMTASPWAAQYVIQHPLVLDSLIAWSTLMEPLDIARVAAAMHEDLDACLLPDGSFDIEQQMNLMRDTQRQVSFQLLAQDLQGILTVERLADQLSALADTLLQEALVRVWPQVCLPDAAGCEVEPQFAIIAYGRLGGKELGYSSDLDLVYLYDDPRDDAPELYAKLARRLTSWLSTMTSSGRLYDIDLRLRPDGDSGLLATSLESFKQYQQSHAWPWEHQALTRARFSAGNQRVGVSFEQIRHEILKRPRAPTPFAQQVRSMRDKMTAGHPNTTALFDLKHDHGGMVDLEFVTQYLILVHAGQHPELLKNLGNIALLQLAGNAGLIPIALAQRASDAYRNLRRRQHEVRLQGADKARVAHDELPAERLAVQELWKVVLGEASQTTGSQ